MNSTFFIFFIATIPIGITVVYYLQKRKEINKLMKRENSKYTGHVNNTFDVFRILRTVNTSETLSKTERRFLIKVLLLVGISWFTAIVWFIYLVFFQNQF